MRLPERNRIVSVAFAMLRLISIYMPNLLAKVPYWGALIAASPRRALTVHRPLATLILVAQAGMIDATAHYMDVIEQIGFRALWRHR
jgi:hypothetical protein